MIFDISNYQTRTRDSQAPITRLRNIRNASISLMLTVTCMVASAHSDQQCADDDKFLSNYEIAKNDPKIDELLRLRMFIAALKRSTDFMIHCPEPRSGEKFDERFIKTSREGTQEILEKCMKIANRNVCEKSPLNSSGELLASERPGSTPQNSQVGSTAAARSSAGKESGQIKGFVYNNAKDCLTEVPGMPHALNNSCNYDILVGEKRPGWESGASGYTLNFFSMEPNRGTNKQNLSYVACRYTGGNDTCTEATVIFLQACRRWEKFPSPIWSYIENQINRFGDRVEKNTLKWNYQAEINKARIEVFKMAFNEQTADDDDSQLACAIRAHSRMRQKLLIINSRYPASFHVTTPYEYWAK